MAKNTKTCHIKFCGISALDCIAQTYCEQIKKNTHYDTDNHGKPLDYRASGFFKSMIKAYSNMEEYTPARPFTCRERQYRCDTFGVIRTDTLNAHKVPNFAEGMEKTISKPDCILALWVDKESPYGMRWKINIDGASIDELTFMQNVLPVYDDHIIKALYGKLGITEWYDDGGNLITAKRAVEAVNKVLRLYPEYEWSILQDKESDKYVVW